MKVDGWMMYEPNGKPIPTTFRPKQEECLSLFQFVYRPIAIAKNRSHKHTCRPVTIEITDKSKTI